MAVTMCQTPGMTNTDTIKTIDGVSLEALDLLVSAAVEAITTATDLGGPPARIQAVSTALDMLESVLAFGYRSAAMILDDALHLEEEGR